jgi:hypothetical protein
MSTCHPLPRTRRRFTGTQAGFASEFRVGGEDARTPFSSRVVVFSSPRRRASAAARSRTCRFVHARAGCILLVICCHEPSCFEQSSRSAASSSAVHGGWYRSRHCLGVRPLPTAAATLSHGKSSAREAYNTASSWFDHGGAPLPTSPRRQDDASS